MTAFFDTHFDPEDVPVVTEEPVAPPAHDVPALLAGGVCFFLVMLSVNPEETIERIRETWLGRLARHGTRGLIHGQRAPELELIACVVCNRVFIGELTVQKSCPECRPITTRIGA